MVIAGFPLGVGSNVDPGFFEPYHPQLQSLADTLRKYTMSFAIVTGGSDGARFDKNHDAQNPGLAVGRAQALRNLLVNEFGIDPGRILIQSSYSVDKGGPYRYAAVRVAREISSFEARIDSLEKRPPVETRITEVKEIYQSMTESMGLQLGAGLSSSPFGGIPIISGAITWKRFVFIEGIFGHTFWDNSFSLENTDLATRRRIAGGLATVYPLSNIPAGITGGWIRVEEISQRYNEYVRMSDGPVIGLQVTPLDYLSITLVQNTAKHNIIGDINSRLKNGQFIVLATVHVLFGGGK
ncbi:MAG: hypothetical protein JSU85_13275 [Candidatus Zixiibacteriota bacterium]|nr:MAG: hypothetical protein JSU85_13275 [candidate division Zixibacteria bacterium]